MSVPEPNDELAMLLKRMEQEGLSSAEQARLSELLSEDEAALDQFVRYQFTDALLAWRFAPFSSVNEQLTEAAAHRDPSVPLPSPALSTAEGSHRATPVLGFLARVTGAMSRPVFWSVLAAGVLFAAYFVSISWNMLGKKGSQPPNGYPADSGQQVAVISGTQVAKWSPDSKSPLAPDKAPKGYPGAGREGTAIKQGELLKIESGLVELKLKQGTTLIVEGPAEWSIDGENNATLNRGKFVARVPQQAVGFTLYTPNATIVDLGTEFAVNASTSEFCDLTVFAGKVRVEPPKSSATAKRTFAPFELSAGEARRLRSLPVASAVHGPQANEQRPVEIIDAEFALQKLTLRRSKPQSNPLDEALWRIETRIPTGNASVSAAGGLIRIANRGYLISQSEYKPSANRPVRVSGRFYWDGPSDSFQLATRSSGVPAGKSGELRDGLEFAYWPIIPEWSRILVRGNQIRISDVRAEGRLETIPGMLLAFELIDRGDDARFAVWQDSLPSNRVTFTAKITHDSSEKYHVVLHNRESAKARNFLNVDGLKIEQSTEAEAAK